MNKQTAVEWLYRWFNDNPEATIKEGIVAFEQAKAMEKEQIVTARQSSPLQMKKLGWNVNAKDGEQYYNETYGK